MISEKMRSAAGYGGDAGDRQSLLSAGADTIDALVAALERMRSLAEAGGDPFSEPGRPTLKTCDAALALARKGG